MTKVLVTGATGFIGLHCISQLLEQDYDVPHGISMIGAQTSELLIMPGQTETFIWEPKQVGVWPFYCTDFCSALHQEMQGYVRVSPASSNLELSWSLGEDF